MYSLNGAAIQNNFIINVKKFAQNIKKCIIWGWVFSKDLS